MRNKKLFDRGIILITVGGFLLAFVSIKSQFESYFEISQWFYITIIITAILTFIIGVFYLIISYKNLEKYKSFSDFEVKHAKYSDLPILHRLCSKLLGDDVIDLKLMNSVFKKNNEVFYKVIEKKIKGINTSEKVVGFFDILPLDEDTGNMLLNKDIMEIPSLSNKVLKKNEMVKAIYVGGVFATNYKSKGVTMAFLKSSIQDYVNKGVKTVYARPTTNIGLRLVQNAGFISLDDNSKIKLNSIYYKEIE